MENDSKTELGTVVQKIIKRGVSKTDLVYGSDKVEPVALPKGFGIRAYVVLTCLDNERFDGEVCSTKKEAEKSAAARAKEVLCLDPRYRAAMQEHVPLKPPKKKKRKTTGGGMARVGGPDFTREQPTQPIKRTDGKVTPPTKFAQTTPQAPNAKDVLHALLSKVTKRTLTKKDDVIYQTTEIPHSGYQSFVVVADLNGQAFQGSGLPQQTKKEAEQSAAEAVLEELGRQPDAWGQQYRDILTGLKWFGPVAAPAASPRTMGATGMRMGAMGRVVANHLNAKA